MKEDPERRNDTTEAGISRRKLMNLGCIGLGAISFSFPGFTRNACAESAMEGEMGSVIDARAFGVKADGVTDDHGAIQKIFDEVLTSQGGVVQLPPGTCLCSRRIINRAKPVIVSGSGRGGTIIHFTGTSEDSVGFLFDQQKYPNTLQLRDLSLITDQQEAGDAVTVVYTGEDCVSMRVVERVYMENVTIVGKDIAQHGFRNGVVMHDTNSPLLYNVCVSGRQPRAGMANRNKTDSCFKLVACEHGRSTPVQAALIKCTGYNARFGVNLTGAHEGLVVTSGNFVECGVGISQNSGPEQGVFEQPESLPEGGLRPGIWITDTHCNVFVAGIYLQKVTQGFIKDCLIYKAPDSSEDCAAIRLSRSSDIKIHHCMFVNQSREGLFEGVLAENGTVRCQISNNTFERCDNILHFASGSAGCHAWNNVAQGGHAGAVLNEGERNKFKALGEDNWQG